MKNCLYLKFYFSVVAYEEQLKVIQKKILRIDEIDLIRKFGMQWKFIRVSSRIDINITDKINFRS